MAKQFQNVSPLVVFLLYMAAAFAVICGYQFLYPPKPMIMVEILGCFSLSWRFIGGVIRFIELFPALAFSGLVIPFGLKQHSEGGYAGNTFVGKRGFSSDFLKHLFWPVITACLSAVTYSLLFFIVLPIAEDISNSIQDRSELFAKAKSIAEKKAGDREWAEASQFIEICESIWKDNEEIAKFKLRLVDSMSSYRQSLAAGRENENEEDTTLIWTGIPGDPVNAADALKLSEDAFTAERYYDAHWLATLAERLAGEGAVETGTARTLASKAWEKIQEMEPNSQEKEQFSQYRMKRDAYEAMNYGNWIGAYYTFLELSVLTPNDPDVIKYLEACKDGVAHTAFFIDELNMAVGAGLNNVVFSFPGANSGRLLVRFNSLALFRDNAYALGIEALASGTDGRLRYRVSSEYAKLVPISGRNSEGESTDHTVLLFQALDRADKTNSTEPVWINETEDTDPEIGANQILVPISFDDFLLLSRVKQGIQTLNLRQLFAAEKIFDDFGYLKENFTAEVLSRMGDAVFFLPMAILTLILGWRYRAMKKPRYVYVPMLVILPVVFHGVVLFYRGVINNLSILLSLSMGLSTAFVFICVGAVVFFLLTLVLLAAQHG
ncbi:MAG: hypothetical protein FWG07_10720 [Treponema sp.]|nr:hypothetical protein [Treponema sp.]